MLKNNAETFISEGFLSKFGHSAVIVVLESFQTHYFAMSPALSNSGKPSVEFSFTKNPPSLFLI